MLQLERRWIVVADEGVCFWPGIWVSVLVAFRCDRHYSAGENEMMRGVDWMKKMIAAASARFVERSTWPRPRGNCCKRKSRGETGIARAGTDFRYSDRTWRVRDELKFNCDSGN